MRRSNRSFVKNRWYGCWRTISVSAIGSSRAADSGAPANVSAGPSAATRRNTTGNVLAARVIALLPVTARRLPLQSGQSSPREHTMLIARRPLQGFGLGFAAFVLTGILALAGAADEAYKTPPPDVVRIFDAPNPPTVVPS